MRILNLLAFLLLLVASPALAGTKACTAAMVTAGICRTTADVAVCVSVSTVDPDTAGPLLAPSALVLDAFTSLENWQTPAPCSPEMVGSGICTSGQIGTLVPITRVQFTDMKVRQFVLGTVRRYLKAQGVTAAQVAADLASDPDIGN
jgi:hypothetical protein